MGQKTNPTALRLEKTNQHYNSCWYSDRFYCEQLHSSYKISNYITKVFYKIKKVPYSKVHRGDRKGQQVVRFKPLIYTKVNHGINQIFCIFPKFRNKLSWRKKQQRVAGKQVSTRLQNFASALPIFYGLCAYKCEITRKPAFLAKKKSIRLLSNVNLVSKAITASDSRGRVAPIDKLCKDLIVNKINSPLNCFNKTTYNARIENLSPLVKALFYSHSQDLQILGHKSKIYSPALPSGETQEKISYFGKKDQSYPLSTLGRENHYQSRLEKVIDESNNLDFAGKVMAKRYKVDIQALPLPAPVTRFAHLSSRVATGSTLRRYPSHQSNLKQVPSQVPFKGVRLYLVKAGFAQQNCQFLAQKICDGLRNRFTFPRLRRTILWDIKKSKYVKGIRVTLSGRVESRSKKAQKARSRTFHWGQTELHVLSSLVQFTSQHLITPRGKIGIKVWICYGA